MKIELVDEITTPDGGRGGNGLYIPSRNTIQISMDTEGAVGADGKLDAGAFVAVAAHEITHRIQDLAPEQYRAYRDYAMNAMAQAQGYGTTANLVEGKLREYAEGGVNLTAEQAMDEIAADFTRDMLHDAGLFKELVQEHRSVARRVLDALKDFIRRVKAAFSSRSAQDRAARSEYGVDMDTLEEAARLWQRAYDAATAQASGKSKSAAQAGGAGRFSIRYDQDNNPYVVIEEDILAGVPRSEWVRTVKDNLRQKFPNGVTVGRNVIEIDKQSRDEMTYSRYTRHLMRTEPELYADKLRATNNADEILRASRNYVNEALAHPRRDSIQEFARGEVLMEIGDKGYSAQVVVAMRSNGKLLLYDILQMEPASIQAKNKKSNAAIAKNPSPGTDRSTASGFTDSISETGGDVNGRYSLKERDREYLSAVESGNTQEAQRLADEAAEAAMPESKIRGQDGRLTPVYHGTRDMGGQLAELGNQASMEVYGYRKFTEPNYFPIQVDRNQTQRDIAKEAQAQTIAGRGFTKGTVPRANNAVMVGSIFDIFASHVNDMATYSAWLPTMENVRRIRDFTFRDSEGNRTGTVKSVIERVFGRNGNAYLNKLVDDLNQGVRTAGSGNFMDSIVGNYKAAAVAANLRVIAQQPTAILRALNTMDAKYLLAGTVRRGDWEKVMKYAPIARWKDWGYFDINTGRQMKDVLLGSSTRLEKLRQAGMAGAGRADSIAWARLWNAVEAETKDRRPGLKPGTDAFYRAVGERFSEIVDQTQVVDGILQRSQIMRSSDALTKISTSFMGEPTKSYNMFVNAVYDLRHATSQQGRSRAKRALARTTTALAVSFTVNAIMQSLVDALRDDDKETDYWEKVFQAFTGFTGDEETVLDYWNSFWSGNLEASYNPLAYMPYFKDLVSIAQGYDVTRMDMEAIEKVWSAFTNMRSALSGEGRYSIAGASANMLAEVARLFGLPVANIKRDVQAVATTAAIETDNYLMQYRMDKALLNIGYQGNRSGFMDILYAASVNDPEAYEIIYEDMVASGITEDQIRTAMESRMKEDQGVESVDELSRRYLTPNQERTYDRLYGQVSSSPVWRAASPEQREAVEEDIYDLTTGTDAGVKLQEKIDGGAAYGISEADYLLYLAAREIADAENEDPEKRNGSIDQAEAQAAIDMLTGLSDEGRAYLWQSTNKGWKADNNPYQ